MHSVTPTVSMSSLIASVRALGGTFLHPGKARRKTSRLEPGMDVGTCARCRCACDYRMACVACFHRAGTCSERHRRLGMGALNRVAAQLCGCRRPRVYGDSAEQVSAVPGNAEATEANSRRRGINMN